MPSKIIVYTDGGARGNPGPAASGAVIEGYDNARKLLWQKKFKEYIGEATNNVAEYRALVLALIELQKIDGANNIEIEIRTDSELMHRQMIGVYRVKDAGLRELFNRVNILKADFKNIKFSHIPREKNFVADSLVNETLDAQ